MLGAILLAPIHILGAVVGLVGSIPGVSGIFGYILGVLLGLLVGYWVFICTLSTSVENPEIPAEIGVEGEELDEKTVKRILPEIPIWVKNPDYDKVDWINTLLREMWPFIDKAVEMRVREIAAPLLEKYKPKAMEYLGIDILTLGTLPPTLAGIKVYDTTDDEMIIEPVLKWAGNPNIVAGAKAFGVKATVQITDLTVFATARITLKPLVPVFPCFTKMTLSLMEKPTVDFGLKLIGGDLMAIPGLYTFVQETISNIVGNMLLWPKSLQLYKSEDAAAGKKPVGWLYVRKLAANSLKNIERFGLIDPYIVLSLGGRLGTKITTVKFNTLNPVWEGEEFQMLVKDPETQALEIKVFDKETTEADRFLSTQRVALKDLIPEEPKPFDLNLLRSLKDAEVPADGKAPSIIRNLGSLQLELTYKPFPDDNVDMEIDETHDVIPTSVPYGGGLLRVHIHEGQSLEGKNYSNPYVKVIFRADERRTQVFQKMTEVDFDEAPFDFPVDEPPSNEELHIQVWSKNMSLMQYINAREPIGHVDIPLRDVVANGRINDIYQLTDSKNGKLKVELEWFEKKQPIDK